MKHQEPWTELEADIAEKFRAYDEGTGLGLERLIELATLGRQHPHFDEWMQVVVLNPQDIEMLQALQEVESMRPKTPFIEQIAQKLSGWSVQTHQGRWMERGHTLPKWSERFLQLLAQPAPAVPAVAVRSRTRHASQAVQLLSPVPDNQGLTETQPHFEWQPVEGSAGYEVHLDTRERAGYREVENALEVEGCQARLKSGIELKRGRIYRLRIRPLVSFEQDPSLRMTKEESFSFRVLSLTAARQVEWAHHHLKDTPVIAALIFYQTGRYHDALLALARWNRQEQQSELAELIINTASARSTNRARLV